MHQGRRSRCGRCDGHQINIVSGVNLLGGGGDIAPDSPEPRLSNLLGGGGDIAPDSPEPRLSEGFEASHQIGSDNTQC